MTRSASIGSAARSTPITRRVVACLPAMPSRSSRTSTTVTFVLYWRGASPPQDLRRRCCPIRRARRPSRGESLGREASECRSGMLHHLRQLDAEILDHDSVDLAHLIGGEAREVHSVLEHVRPGHVGQVPGDRHVPGAGALPAADPLFGFTEQSTQAGHLVLEPLDLRPEFEDLADPPGSPSDVSSWMRPSCSRSLSE